MYLLHTSVYSGTEIWLLKESSLRQQDISDWNTAQKVRAGQRGGGSGLLNRVSSTRKNWIFYFCPQLMKMVSTGTVWFLHLISDDDALDILLIFWFSCLKGKEMCARWQRLFLCKIPLPDVSKYYKQNYHYSPCQNNRLTWNLTTWTHWSSQLSSLWEKVIAWNNFRHCNLKIRFKISKALYSHT